MSARATTGRDGVTVLWKRPDVKEGLADLPWHRDCGMGGHALNCPTLIMTICLTDGSAAAGELRALPGSQHMTHPTIDGTEEGAPRGVSFARQRRRRVAALLRRAARVDAADQSPTARTASACCSASRPKAPATTAANVTTTTCCSPATTARSPTSSTTSANAA